jgi:uncharacterized membrane protein HdeD (DUF308 family)
MMTSERPQPLRDAAAKAVGAVWWYFLVRGLLLLGAGIFVLLKPGLSAVGFAQVIGVVVLVDGALAVVAGIAGSAESRFWSIVRGVLMVIGGLFVFLQPALVARLAVTTVFYIIAPLVVINGILEVVASFRGREKSGKKASLLSGVLTLIFGVLLFLAPLSFGVLIVSVLGIVAILIGLILLFLAFKFRKLRNRIEG